MEHWNDQTCQGFRELGFGSAIMMSCLALGASTLLAFGLGII